MRRRYATSGEVTRRPSSPRARSGSCCGTSSRTSRACRTSSEEHPRHEHPAPCGYRERSPGDSAKARYRLNARSVTPGYTWWSAESLPTRYTARPARAESQWIRLGGGSLQAHGPCRWSARSLSGRLRGIGLSVCGHGRHHAGNPAQQDSPYQGLHPYASPTAHPDQQVGKGSTVPDHPGLRHRRVGQGRGRAVGLHPACGGPSAETVRLRRSGACR